MPGKAALARRVVAELLFYVRIFAALLLKFRRGDVALTVPAPLMLPYAFAVAAKLRGARSVLIMHHLYSDVLILVGLVSPQSMLAKAVRAFNALMFRAIDAVVIIGRDTEKLLLRYGGMTRDKIHFIPNWGDACSRRPRSNRSQSLSPPAFRPIRRRPVWQFGFYPRPRHRVRGSSAVAQQQGYPLPALRLGRWLRLTARNATRGRLSNVTLGGRLEDEQLEELLSAADVWIIPYRKNVAGVSYRSPVGSTILLAIGP